jgi:glycosyltransferase involved in cell wall biosynthesis
MVKSAVEAALAQSRGPMEVIVSDDASTDDTASVIANLAQADSRVKLLRQETNSGGVRNWNRAIEATTGDLIAWCSDDDCYRPGHLGASAAYLEQHPQVAMVHSGFVDWIDTPEAIRTEERALRYAKTSILDRNNLLRYMLRYYNWPFHPSTIVMRRRVWEEVGAFNPAYALADTDWFVRAVRAFPVAMLARHGVNNRRHLGNWSNRLGSVAMQREIHEIVDRTIGDVCGTEGLRRRLWSQAWKTNVRLRLLLTAYARLRSGHPDAASAAWNAALGETVFPKQSAGILSSCQEWLVGAGDHWLRTKASRAVPATNNSRQRVSPL